MLKILDQIQEMTSSELAAIVAELPQWRQDKVAAYKHIEDRRESALSFHLLQQMLASEYAISDISFDFGEHGKPALHNHNDIHFNISHCRNAVACVVATHPVGVDIERLGRYKEQIARHTLSDSELEVLHRVQFDGLTSEESADLQFTIFWTMKESLLKLLGTGITDDLRNILHMYDGRVKFETTVNLERRYVCCVAEHMF